MSAFDRQSGGSHYKLMMIQPLEYALANDLGICEHAVIKYVSRWKIKGGVEDLRKAIHYCEILIERELDKPLITNRHKGERDECKTDGVFGD
tara:strand:+ start:294 stop:569 length:276 start_codon:yes stop_codon:yes gene_type:complete